MGEITFSTTATVARKSRFVMAEQTRSTAEGGRVGVGTDSNGSAYLVHEIGRQTEAVALGAVATAVAGGAIPVRQLVKAFGETGLLAQLVAEVAKTPEGKEALVVAAPAPAPAPEPQAKEEEKPAQARKR
jgi:hypothetical protein